MQLRWLLLSVVVALEACQSGNLGVPIGDPERSRINPQLSGVWYVSHPEDETKLAMFMADPYDERTWLVRQISLDPGIPVPASPDGLEAWLKFEMKEVLVCNAMKTWTTRLGGVEFVVAEPQFELDAQHGFLADGWIVYRLEMQSPDLLGLTLLDSEFKAAEDGPELYEIKTTREAERVIRRNARNPALYGVGVDNDAPRGFKLRRLPAAAFDELDSAINRSRPSFLWCTK